MQDLHLLKFSYCIGSFVFHDLSHHPLYYPQEIATASNLEVHATGVMSHDTDDKTSDIYQYRHDANPTMSVLLKNFWDIFKVIYPK